MTDCAREYRALERKRDRSEMDVRAMQEQIKARLREKGVRKIPGVLVWTSVKGRSGYDNKTDPGTPQNSLALTSKISRPKVIRPIVWSSRSPPNRRSYYR